MPTDQRRPRRREGGRRFIHRRKVCNFCVEHIDHIDYKDLGRLHRYLSDRGKIGSRRRTGVCAKHQRPLARAIKRARHLALLPFTEGHARSFTPQAIRVIERSEPA